MGDADYKDALDRYRALVAEVMGDTVKGKANPYTSMNGNMYSFLDKTGLICLRLSAEDRAAFAAAYRTEPVVQYGSVMKDYVPVTEALLADADALRRWAGACAAHARTLPAKATKR